MKYKIARFWSQVDVREYNECWVWLGPLTPFGHGRFGKDGAHRFAYEFYNGPIEHGAVIRHKCDNPRCCNPAHLSSGTHADNVKDRVEHNRSAVGEMNGRSKLTEDEVRHIRQAVGSNELLARTYGVDKTTIRLIRTRQTWAHVE